jgi:hypothetical protein
MKNKLQNDHQKTTYMTFDDELLKKMYMEYDTPCDSLVSDPTFLSSFTEDYCERAQQKNIDPAEMGQRLLHLRKKGEDKDGLPRLRRKYCGRNLRNHVVT